MNGAGSSQGELTKSDPMQVGRVQEGTTNAGSGAEGSSDSGIGVEKENVWAVSGFKQVTLHESALHKKARGKGIFLAKDPRWGKELGKEERWVRKGEKIMEERG